ncbi:MAG: hypothetical protein AAGF53_15730 [Pseudomonadota bacterium]
MKEAFLQRGWAKFPAEASLDAWVSSVQTAAQDSVAAPEMQHWLVCQGTWFVGVDALPNDMQGRVQHGPVPRGGAFDLAMDLYGDLPLHAGQVSVIYPGYPKPRGGESEKAFGYRLRRDAAHVDGILAVGDERRRHLMERHAYILGVSLSDCDESASPLSIWEGSHLMMRAAFENALRDVPENDWDKIDLTEVYQATRREVFETCERILLPLRPGESYLVHRLALHGVSPWQDGARAPEEGRMIAYFRPEWQELNENWLNAP